MANGSQDHHSFEDVGIQTARDHAVVSAMTENSVGWDKDGGGVAVVVSGGRVRSWRQQKSRDEGRMDDCEKVEIEAVLEKGLQKWTGRGLR